MSPTALNFIPALISSFVAWRIYRRVRRNIGRQPFQPRRLLLRVFIFSVICMGLGIYARGHAQVLVALAGGLVPGALLGLLGLRLTRFDVTPEGRFYTPNIYLGVGLSLLLVGRLIYRLLMVRSAPAFNPSTPGLMKSPLTFFIFGLLAGYYVVYLSGVFLRCRRLALLPAQ